ncbi:MAG: TolC family protein, partial [Burkholderiales bacterium]|nr:TolC family protein [Burkholderiales bacterium]
LLSAWSNLATAKQRATLGSRQVKSAKELVSGYDQQFRVGRRSLLDLLTVEDNLFSYQVSVTNASFEERNAKARILAILNQLASSYELAEVPAGSSAVIKTGDVAAPKRPIFSNAN